MASILRVNTLTDASSNNSIAMSFVAPATAKYIVHYDQAIYIGKQCLGVMEVTSIGLEWEL